MKNIGNNLSSLGVDATQTELNFIDVHEQEKKDFIRKIGVIADYDIKGVVKGPDGIWRIHGMTPDEWRKYLKDEHN